MTTAAAEKAQAETLFNKILNTLNNDQSRYVSNATAREYAATRDKQVYVLNLMDFGTGEYDDNPVIKLRVDTVEDGLENLGAEMALENAT